MNYILVMMKLNVSLKKSPSGQIGACFGSFFFLPSALFSEAFALRGACLFAANRAEGLGTPLRLSVSDQALLGRFSSCSYF